MSFAEAVPAFATMWSSVVFLEEITATVRDTGVLIFASAGNSGADVDEEQCFVACWESTWWSPCENDGVIRVGGLAPNSRDRDPGSNYGSGHVGDVSTVDIYAPFSVLAGPDPTTAANVARWVSGTSFSSPYVAGVAALVWAANPALTADQVESILYSTAAPSYDFTVQTDRIVMADFAVEAALGNLPPAVMITAPADGSQVQFGGFNAVDLKATALDFEDGNKCCKLTWKSSNPLDDIVANGTQMTIRLGSAGVRTLSVTAQDLGGAKSTASIDITGVDVAPSVFITKPSPGETIYTNVPNVFAGDSFDENELGFHLACNQLSWTSNEPGDPALGGCNPDFKFATSGNRTLTLAGTDLEGKSGQATVGITVVDPPSNGPPIVAITLPVDGTQFWPGQNSVPSGSAVGHGPFTYVWKTNVSGVDVPVVFKTEFAGKFPLLYWTPSDYLARQCGTSSGQLKLYATDANGLTGSDHVTVGVTYGPC